MKISTIIIAYNAQETIAQALQSVGWTDEVIVVIDTPTNDATEEICRRYTSKIFHRKLDTHGKQRNFAIDQASNDWILTLDSDEFLSPELALEMRGTMALEATSYDVLRRNRFMERWMKHGDWGGDWQTRLFNRKHARYDEVAIVHEGLVFTNDRRARLNGLLYHYTYNSLEYFSFKLCRDATREAEVWLTKGKKFHAAYIFSMPLQRFFKGYVQRFGFLDGFEGLVHAIFQAFYMFIKFLKVRELLSKRKPS